MKRLMNVGIALLTVAGVAAAQNPPAPRPGVNRAELEQQVRNRIGTQLKNELRLSDDQFTKLQATNRRFQEKRRLLVGQERDARMAMRDLLITGDTASQGKVSAAIDRMLQIQRQRFDLLEQEQKELAAYLSPMQRARFLGMQEQMRRRVDNLRAGRGAPGRVGKMGPGMNRPRMGEGVGPTGGRMRPGQGMPKRQGRPPAAVPPQGAPRPPVPPV